METKPEYKTKDDPKPRPHIWYIHLSSVVIGPPEEEMLALFDAGGQIVQWEEILNILEAAKPFYSRISPSNIAEFNGRPKTIVHGLEASPPKTSQPISGHVYLMKCGPHCEIGASKDPDLRLAQLSTKPPFDIELLHTIPTDDMYTLESKLHDRFADKRKNGEWFELAPEDVEYIKGL